MLPFSPLHVAALHPLFARAGGGGSGSGGGSGGIIVLAGYVPMHLLGAYLRRIKARHALAFDVLQVGGWLVAVFYSLVLLILLHVLGGIIALGAILGMGAGLYGWFGKLRPNKRVESQLQAASQIDPAWDEATLIQTAQTIFMQYQQDWSALTPEPMKAYLTPQYQYHANLLMGALYQLNRRNDVQNVQILDAVIVEVQDAPSNQDDQVVVGFNARADDRLLVAQTGQELFKDTNPFTEFWRFRRGADGVWLLDGIQQATAARWLYNAPLEDFASANGYCFSLDMGWLLLPRRGQLFGKGRFGVADINNHVIGVHGQCLVQLYTYTTSRTSTKSYLIAQTSLPKSYGNIVVRKKRRWQPFGIRGLNRISTEWTDFNKKFEVFASDVEQVTSFELLTPTYMEKLEALPFEINMEVVDNIVYLYAPEVDDALPERERYEVMLRALNQAFQELRL